VPADPHAGEDLVHEREHSRYHCNAHTDVDDAEEPLGIPEHAAPPLPQRRQPGADHERNQEQKSDADHESQGQHSTADQSPYPLGLLDRWRLPDAVEVTLQFGEYRRSPYDKQHDTNDAGDGALVAVACAFDHLLYRRSALVTEQAPQLRVEVAARRLAAEKKAGDGDHDNQQRRN